MQEHLERCDLEIRKIADYKVPYAWLNAIGEADWEIEKLLILEEYLQTSEYIKNVLTTESCDWAKIAERVQSKLRLMHGLAGLVTEVGELEDQFKKHVFYGRDLDRTNLVEELGDLMWYVALICDDLKRQGETGDDALKDIMVKNIAKLRARYAGKFTETRAENRDLDAERLILEGK